MSTRILVVEDDPAILRGLELNLQLEGFDVLAASDGLVAIDIGRRERVDLVVLDVMLPHANGYQVCRALRETGSDVPIILLSAKNAELDIVMGLDLGADDYVTKPFRIGELMARIKAHLRRRAPVGRYQFGDVEIDLERREVRRGAELLEMSTREFDLLRFLVEREGKAITRDTILRALWGHDYFGTDRTVDNFITRLRQKVDRPGEPSHIVTVRGVGYRFVSGNEAGDPGDDPARGGG